MRRVSESRGSKSVINSTDILIEDYHLESTSTDRLYPSFVLSTGLPRLWNKGYTGKNISIAILDTGIDSHPDLRDKIIYSRNFTNNNSVGLHATIVAGIASANGWMIGSAPDSKLLNIKVLTETGGTISNLINGINDAVDHGATIINMSLGTTEITPYENLNLSNSIKQAWNRGVLCIAAAGNDGVSLCTPDPFSYPASDDLVISVGSCKVQNDLDTISVDRYSNENERVDIVAPGTDIASTGLDGKYSILSGTSMATPVVSGGAACLAQQLKEMNPDLIGPSFCQTLVSKIYSNCKKLPGSCKISSGNGFLRIDPLRGPVIPYLGKEYFYQNYLIGYLVSNDVTNIGSNGKTRVLIKKK